jgi:protein dithiol oxidoreductase (disulfide-forming)
MRKPMLKLFSRFVFIIMMLSIAACSSQSPQSTSHKPLQAGVDYQLIPPAIGVTAAPKNKIEVVEFFSYGCPWCFRFESTLQPWLASQPSDVAFSRVPVVFQPGWSTLARAYYTAKNLGVENKITPAIFDAIHVKQEDLTTQAALEKFFIAEGVSKQNFDSAFNFTPGIDAQMMRGDQLMRAYNIFEVPTLVIDGKYKTNIVMTKGNVKRLVEVLDFLIAQERKDLKNTAGITVQHSN